MSRRDHSSRSLKSDAALMSRKAENKVWKRHSESDMNVDVEGKTEVTSMEVEVMYNVNKRI